jgi:flavin reductase (DIM6/NTAB) family NADH-FMN oxidoreductase RutF
MELDPAEASMYRWLSGAVVPRPIAWVSTDGPAGQNLAPYSFFNVMCISPPILAFAPGQQADEERKDTLGNILDREAFVVNLVPVDLGEPMVASSGDHEGSEFAAVGVTPVAGTEVDAPRVAESPLAFECRLHDTLELGSNTATFGRVVRIHAADELLEEGKLDTTRFDALGRLAGNYYATTRDRLRIERPD